jgi:dCTP diphosphatase
MKTIQELTQHVVDFRDARDWKQFQTPKDLAVALVLEATEVLEHFQWQNSEEMKKHVEDRRGDIGEELADTLFVVLLMSHDFGIDIAGALEKKLVKNAAKYPIEKAKGNHKKYTELT